jgi:alanine racemase
VNAPSWQIWQPNISEQGKAEMMKERSRVEINLDNFRHNLNELKKYLLPGQSFLQIVKADAYGHGAFEISKTALEAGAVMLGVANPEEGKLLRIQGISAPILVLSPALREEIPVILEYNLAVTLSELSFARALSKAAVEDKSVVNVHIKVDTGMHRSGFRSEEFAEAYRKISKLPGLSIEGILSHYAASENDDRFSAKQSKEFEKVLSEIRQKPRYIHLANSSALIKHNSFHTNLVRLGIMSYGIYTDNKQYEHLKLKSVMAFKSTLAHVKNIRKGEYVGYNCTWKAPRDGRYGIIPIGYADGYDFLLSNLGIVSIRGQICNVIGKVSMDMITVDLTSIPAVKSGDEVILMGGGTNLLRAEHLASKYKGSAYELLCQVGRRAKRFYFENGKLISQAPLSRRDFVSTDYSDSKLGDIISSAISQRLQDEEIADLIYREVLRGFFYNKDKDIQYRKDFVHSIEFVDDKQNPDYYVTKTKLSFTKRLQNDYFTVACANSDEVLKRYFLRRDVEYRWLMDTNFALTSDEFVVSRVMIDNIRLRTVPKINRGCLEIKCTSPKLKELTGKEVKFTIETETLYPKASHQLSIFITELTKGVTVRFRYPSSLKNIETLTVFSGKNKYPDVSKGKAVITVTTDEQEWVFPNSGIVFAY